MLTDHGLGLNLKLPDQPVSILGDRTRLAQTVGNLLQNACKFTKPGGIVCVELAVEEKASAILRVQDNGIGIEPKALAWIFEPFSQAERSLDRSRGGLGLGLALAKGIVELHGGSITASSNGPGLGAEFTVRLPLDQTLFLPASPTPDENRRSGSYRILVVEDNPLGARSMLLLLQRRGHRVEVAHNGLAAVEAARKFEPDVVLCDIGLPGLDGYGVAQALRREVRLNRSMFIAVSGYAEDERRAAEVGFNAHLIKPVDLEKLERLLAAFAGRGQGQKDNRQ